MIADGDGDGDGILRKHGYACLRPCVCARRLSWPGSWGVFLIEFSFLVHVTPTMRLYLPCVEARLRGITALWFCRKKCHLHTIPCNEQEWDKELAYNRHFTQYINKSYINQSTHIDRLRAKPKEKEITQLLDP